MSSRQPRPTDLFVFVDVDTQGSPLFAQSPEALTRNIRRLVSFAAERAIPLIATVTVAAGDSPREDGAMGEPPPGAIRLGMGLAPVPRPLPSRVILEKPGHDLFANPNAMAVIEQLYGRTAVVFGLGDGGRLKSAVLGLRRHGLPCRLMRDAAAFSSAEERAAAERAIIETGALILSTDEMLAEVAARLDSLSR